MPRYHGVFTDETGQGEFGVTIDADNRADARDQLEEDYPECRLTSLLSEEEIEEREREREARLWSDDYDDYGY